MARLHRLSSKEPVDITLFLFERTIDEKIALALDSKLADTNLILKGGSGETGLAKALEFAPEDWESHMSDVAAGRVVDVLTGWME